MPDVHCFGGFFVASREGTPFPHQHQARICLCGVDHSAVTGSTAIRSFGGMSMDFPWKSTAIWGTFLMFAAATGKMAGGFAADYAGRIRASVIALVLAGPLIVWGKGGPAMGITGVFLFQTTMAVTLLTLFEQMPQYPGFAFGMLCFGLWIGVFSKQVLAINLPPSPLWQLGLILASCAALAIALWLNDRDADVTDQDLRS